MKVSDLDAVAEIERRSFSTPWHRSAFLSGLRTPHIRNYIVEYRRNLSAGLPNKRMIGYACFQLDRDEIHLLKIAVEPKWRRQGVAKLLLKRCIDAADRKGFHAVILQVRRSNSEAIAASSPRIPSPPRTSTSSSVP